MLLVLKVMGTACHEESTLRGGSYSAMIILSYTGDKNLDWLLQSDTVFGIYVVQ